ncbi:lysozyme [Tieghemostelium lacteum]|uniref:Lysozyme n=1 Tax=Tieghemostelium lacteum TaxID=361077 RepID=A0A151ZKB2_TIELA|nr:lysozyme [Tieghemostelium lacteum]|eukprot:KYQ94413.1 lysozyme [Tieghemostelium lacteum]
MQYSNNVVLAVFVMVCIQSILGDYVNFYTYQYGGKRCGGEISNIYSIQEGECSPEFFSKFYCDYEKNVISQMAYHDKNCLHYMNNQTNTIMNQCYEKDTTLNCTSKIVIPPETTSVVTFGDCETNVEPVLAVTRILNTCFTDEAGYVGDWQYETCNETYLTQKNFYDSVSSAFSGTASGTGGSGFYNRMSTSSGNSGTVSASGSIGSSGTGANSASSSGNSGNSGTGSNSGNSGNSASSGTDSSNSQSPWIPECIDKYYKNTTYTRLSKSTSCASNQSILICS